MAPVEGSFTKATERYVEQLLCHPLYQFTLRFLYKKVIFSQFLYCFIIIFRFSINKPVSTAHFTPKRCARQRRLKMAELDGPGLDNPDAPKDIERSIPMTSSVVKRVLNATLALGLAGGTFTALPATSAVAAPATAKGTTVAYGYVNHPNREAVQKVTAQIPNHTVKSHTEFTYDLSPYIKNADDFTVLVRGLPQGVKYDIDTKTISGSTPFTGNYSVSVFLKGRRDKWLQTFKLNVNPSYADPNGYPRNTDNPNLNRQPHTWR